MSMPSFTAEVSLYHSRHHYQVHDQYARPEANTIVPAQRCPFPCLESNVACIPSPIPFVPGLLFNTCWCPKDGNFCPEGGWWVAGVCIGAWINGCYPQTPPGGQ